MTEEPGLDLLKTVEWAGVLIVIQKRQPDGSLGEPKVLTAPAEKLDIVLTKGAREFHDPTQPPTPPFPEHLLSASISRIELSNRTAPTAIGRGKRAR